MHEGKKPAQYGELWTRDEVILALELYCRIPFRLTKANNPDVKELAALLNRSPAGVARKLGNLGSFDPELRKRDVSGLSHVNKMDGIIWTEFEKDWSRLALEAKRLRENLGEKAFEAQNGDENLSLPAGPSERESLRAVRIHQAFFRDSVLSSYDDTCCVTGLQIKECLIASHIIPWSVSEQHRADPRNGLCLSATFDRLFDQGLIAIGHNREVIVSSSLRKRESVQIKAMVCAYHGSPMIPPRRFQPNAEFLNWHLEQRFRA